MRARPRFARGGAAAVLLLAALLAASAVAQNTLPRARRSFSVAITEPADDAIVVGPTRIAADVITDQPDKVLQVTFLVDDATVFVDREAPYQTVFDFGREPRRAIIQVVATHAAGFSVEDSVVTRELKLSYTVEVRRVRLVLSVVDADGRPVAGLTREDVRVLEDGAVQEIIDFEVEERPLRLAVVLDTSGSMRQELPEVQQAASGFLDVLRPQDRAMVIDFDDQVLLLQDLTGNRDDLRAALMSTFARGGTAMYDAIHATLRRLAPETERKAVILLSDGGDTASVFDRERAVEAARTADVLIYTIGVGGDADRGTLKAIAREGGGRAFFADKGSQLAAVYARIADELRSQYLITYRSSNPEYDGRWRKVSVEYTGSGQATVRHRPGYYAVRTVTSPLDSGPISGPEAAPSPPDPEGEAAPDRERPEAEATGAAAGEPPPAG